MALAAYNWGPGHVDTQKVLPRETVSYIRRIRAGYRRYAQALQIEVTLASTPMRRSHAGKFPEYELATLWFTDLELGHSTGG